MKGYAVILNEARDLFCKIDRHITCDIKPSLFLSTFMENRIFTECCPFTMISCLEKVEQNIKFHPEGNVFNHTLMVLDEAASRKSDSKNERVLMWSALLHDIGKAPATKIRNGRITSYNHEKIGSVMAVEFLKVFTDDMEFINNVASMVRWHMEALFVIKDLPFSNIKKMLDEVSLDEIALLNLCDRLGRGNMTGEKIDGEIKDIRIFIDKCRNYKYNN